VKSLSGFSATTNKLEIPLKLRFPSFPKWFHIKSLYASSLVSNIRAFLHICGISSMSLIPMGCSIRYLVD